MKQGVYQHLNLAHLEAALPQVLDRARTEQWTYETFLERALGSELDGREQKAIARRLKAARIPGKKTLDGFDFSFQPSLSERRLRELADLSFVRTCTNLVFLGPPGTGKTPLSLALADRALVEGYSVLFTTLADLAQALESASHPGLMRQRLRLRALLDGDTCSAETRFLPRHCSTGCFIMRRRIPPREIVPAGRIFPFYSAEQSQRMSRKPPTPSLCGSALLPQDALDPGEKPWWARHACPWLRRTRPEPIVLRKTTPTE
jgi:hypothetical protein